MTDYANFIEVLGIRFVEVGKDRIVAEMEAGPQHSNGSDVVHGGVYMAFADTLGARGAIMNLPEGMRTSTLESKTNFLRGTAPGKLTGESTPVHVGRTTQVWQTVVTDAKGRKLAVVTQTQIVIPASDEAAKRQQAMKTTV
ncbi:MAG: PaaI family thioesterase [Alphaproteobacteria bacterium]